MPHYRFDTFSTLHTKTFSLAYVNTNTICMRFPFWSTFKSVLKSRCVFDENALSVLCVDGRPKHIVCVIQTKTQYIYSLPTAPKSWLILRYINSDYCVFTAELIMSLKQVIPWKKDKSIFLNKGRFSLLYTWERYALPPMPRQWTGSAFRTDDICATWIISL